MQQPRNRAWPVLDTFQTLSSCGILSCMEKDLIDSSVSPPYYNGDDVMQIIERYNLSFCLGNVIKYVLRAKNKNGVQDLKKALWYLEREIGNNG
jgi:hypothetical protein